MRQAGSSLLSLVGALGLGCRASAVPAGPEVLAPPSAAPALTASAAPSVATSVTPPKEEKAPSETLCFRAYYGLGEPASLAAARDCFERVVRAEKGCGGGSSSLPRLFLGLMLLDAQGGPRDRPRGEALFADCLGDSGVGAAALARERSGGAKPVDFCADIGGNTLDTQACAVIQQDREDLDAEVATKELQGRLALDDVSLELQKKANAAFAKFVSADADYASDVYRGGSMRGMQLTYIAAARTKSRSDMLRALLVTKPPRPDADAELRRAEASARASAKDAENKQLLADAGVAWAAYRAAETAFVKRAFAKLYGSEASAARALAAELAKRRAADLGDAMKALRGE